LATADAAAPPLPDRPEVVRSRFGPQERCEIGESGLMLVCSAARRLDDGRIVHVMRGTPRLVRSLYEERFQLAALTLGVLVFGIGLALWLGWRIVSPIEQLRDQVVARTQGRFSTQPVAVVRQDEVGDLAAAFNALLGVIDERKRANTNFAADLAHELKNPVAAVRAAAEALGADRPVEGERLERLRRVLADASRRMESVVHQFLELARAEAGLPDVVREELDLARMVDHLLEPVRVDERYPHLKIDFSGDSVIVNAVPERLETAVRNVLANAAAFAKTHVSVTVSRVEGVAELLVSDDGPGIPVDEVPELFTRYRTRRAGGTGLGLAMTKAIVEAHGGSIDVEQAPSGTGASFRIQLPSV
jgi:signal transduction histidine kinase